MKKAIQRKTAIFIFIVGILPVIVGTSFVYLQGRKEITESVGKDFEWSTREIASDIKTIMEQYVADIRALSVSPALRDAVRAANKAYAGRDEASIAKEIRRMELQWVNTGSKDESLKKYILNPAATYLLDIKRQRDEYAELFITDSRGVLVASTDKTKYIYFGKEDWWQTAYNNGKGDLYISKMYLDPYKNKYVQGFAAPIMDEGGNHLLGVVRIVHKIERLSQVVQKFRIGKSGHVMLINSSRSILIYSMLPPHSQTITEELMRDITLNNSRGWAVVKDNARGDVDAISGFAPLAFSFDYGKNIFGGNKWYTFVSQSPEESYAPMRTL
ncbi:MAG TPA: cache domain-containing protein, partial [Candidatus Brocadiales bacterium]|nr:cache domain-containing protein [Candidatus Brocadiales bacterium]